MFPLKNLPPTPTAEYVADELKAVDFDTRVAVNLKNSALKDVKKAADDYEGPTPRSVLDWYRAAFGGVQTHTSETRTVVEAFQIEASFFVRAAEREEAAYETQVKAVAALSSWLQTEKSSIAASPHYKVLEGVLQALDKGESVQAKRMARDSLVVSLPCVRPDVPVGTNVASYHSAIVAAVEQAFAQELVSHPKPNITVRWT